MSERPPIIGTTVPRVREGIDIIRVGLSQEEGIVISRLDGRTSVKDLGILVGQPLPVVQSVVERLVHAGVLVVGEAEKKSDGCDDFLFPKDALEEEVDLSDDEKKRILYTHAQLNQWSAYELLSVRYRADAKAIKRAYHERSKEWHPDRFRRSRLGSYQARIEDIFRAVWSAYDVLSDAKKRSNYDQQHLKGFDEDDMAEILAERRSSAQEVDREKERKRRRLARNPLRKRMDRAKSLHNEAKVLMERGDVLEALQLAQAACALDERDSYLELKRHLQQETAEYRVAPLMRRGMHAERMTSWSDAVRIFSEAVRVAPEHGPARLRLAYNLLMSGRSSQEVSEHIHMALQKMPQNPEAHFVRGLCYEKIHMEKAAIRAFQRAIELKPNYAEAKKRLKKLRWGF
ncbi:MAG: DnaJ domain-containing protein [Myxococcales bacterium]|nr:DnaJ domain-containing protein [Myxococcales bacterium]